VKDPQTLKPDFYENLKNEITGEIAKMGPIASIKIFERNPEGVAAIKYKTSLAAIRCINIMGGRYFDGRKLEATYYDGHTNYFVEETAEERRRRDEAWAKWLEGNEEYEERKKQEIEDNVELKHNGPIYDDESTNSEGKSSSEESNDSDDA